MREDAVYLAAKRWFQNRGFVVLAGQPPGGCDNIPVIEIKDDLAKEKGSRRSFKPDLIVANDSFFLVIECKPLDSKADELKLMEVDSSPARRRALYREVTQRGIFERRGLMNSYRSFEDFDSKVRYCLAHSGELRVMDRVLVLLVSSDNEGSLSQPIEHRYRIF
jgi:hypothetical protein